MATSAVEGIAYDVILLEWNLPDAEGIHLCSVVHRVSPRTAIIMLTERSALADMIGAFDCGIDDYLAKPGHLIPTEFARNGQINRRTPG